MATKLFLRNTQLHGLTPSGDTTWYDMVTTAGAASDTAVVNTTASGTQIQFTKTAGGAVIAWISGRAPAGGFTLTAVDVDLWLHESNMNANCGGRIRVFKRAADGTITELGAGPFDDGVEFGTATASMTWTGNPTDTAFAEDDRILLRVYITNIGTMGGNFTCTLTFNAADASNGDSFFNIAETITFKPEDQGLTGPSPISSTVINVPDVAYQVDLPTLAQSVVSVPTLAYVVELPTLSLSQLFEPTVAGEGGADQNITGAFILTLTLSAPSLAYQVDLPVISASQLFSPTLAYAMVLPALSASQLFSPTLLATYELSLPAISASQLFSPTLAHVVLLPALAASQLFAPSLAQQVDLPSLAGTALFVPVIAYVITLPTVADTALFVPAVTDEGGLALPVISASQLFAPTLETVYGLTLPALATTLLNAPALEYAVQLPAVASGLQLFAPLVTVDQQLSLPWVDATQLFVPSVSFQGALDLPALTGTLLFAPIVATYAGTPTTLAPYPTAFTTLAQCDNELRRLQLAYQDRLVQKDAEALIAMGWMRMLVRTHRRRLVAAGVTQ